MTGRVLVSISIVIVIFLLLPMTSGQSEPRDNFINMAQGLANLPRDFLNIITWGNLAQEELSKGHYELAVEYCNKCISDNYLTFNCHKVKGESLLLLRRYEEALIAFNKSKEVAPNIADNWYGIALSMVMLNRSEESLYYIDRALELEPDNFIYLEIKILALNNLGRYEETLMYYDKLIDLFSGETIIDANIWRSKGDALRNLEKYDDAIKAYDKAIYINPNDSVTSLKKSEVLSILNHTSQANIALQAL